MKLILVAGARPNFIKIAPLMREMQSRPGLSVQLVHTGQHYDARMSQLFFEELRIPRPDVELKVGSASHAVQTAEIMKLFEPIVQAERPDALVVVGDVNSTIACALTAVKLGVRVAHVEAGLRSFDRTMPEEINRLLTDALAEWLFVSERSGLENLRREGVAENRLYFVGNVMIDTLMEHRERSESSTILEDLKLTDKGYSVLTLHRPASVDDPQVLRSMLSALARIGRELPFIFPVHPRTRKVLQTIQGVEPPTNGAWMRLTDPLGYLDFLKLMAHARMVFTDSGGVQEETTILGIPCLTLRTSTERPATITEGSNVLVGLAPERIIAEGLRVLGQERPTYRVPELWDGRAAARIVDGLTRERHETKGERPA
ncbi:MAG TPA: UDP-N-acetylglucosamine 2-epimerase (non-hydrolyzing) [Gemmataceae bacterium]|nr:UDP-N-acetylglucosamine 2-epimerase (non-hydrolyzing) [Gemmataceae bacterium]